jgi:hypothetical protein
MSPRKVERAEAKFISPFFVFVNTCVLNENQPHGAFVKMPEKERVQILARGWRYLTKSERSFYIKAANAKETHVIWSKHRIFEL